MQDGDFVAGTIELSAGIAGAALGSYFSLKAIIRRLRAGGSKIYYVPFAFIVLSIAYIIFLLGYALLKALGLVH